MSAVSDWPQVMCVGEEWGRGWGTSGHKVGKDVGMGGGGRGGGTLDSNGYTVSRPSGGL